MIVQRLLEFGASNSGWELIPNLGPLKALLRLNPLLDLWVLTLQNIKKTYVIYALTLSLASILLLSSGHFENPDAQLRLSQAFSLTQNGNFQLADTVGNSTHGNIATNQNGERYSVYAPGQILLFTPIAYFSTHLVTDGNIDAHYIAEIFASFLGVAAHILTAWVIFYFSRLIGRSPYESMLLSFLFAFATFNLPSSRDGYEHTYEALFITMSYCFSYYYSKKDIRNFSGISAASLLIPGFILGIGVLFRPTTILALPGLFIICKYPKHILLACIGLLPSCAIFLAYNTMRFGDPLETGYTQAWLIANPNLITKSGFNLMQMIPQSVSLWISSGKGMLLFSPILLALFFTPSSKLRQWPAVTVAILITVIIYSLFYGANFAWHGSAWSWGPRYLVPLTPLLILIMPVVSRQHWRGKIITFLAVASVTIQIFATLTNYKRHLLKTYIENPAAFTNGDIFFNLHLSPLMALPNSFMHLIMRIFDSDTLYTYFITGPWLNESRNASIPQMLESSIDLNSFDIWWVRLQHFPFSDNIKFFSLVVGVLSLSVIVLILVNLFMRTRK